MRRILPHTSSLAAIGVAWLLLASVVPAGEPILAGYADYRALGSRLQAIAKSEFADLESLGRTLGGREVYLLKIGAGNLDEKPAILLVGSAEPPHLVGSELAVRLAARVVDQAAKDAEVRKLLDRFTLYVIPRPAPDACEAFFHKPYWQRTGNQRATDEDRDFAIDEDGPDDLNGDGLITMIRVEDPAGTYMPHASDPRVMVQADPKKNEQGRYKLYTEGVDNDHDDQFNEDPAGGVAFDRNFTFRYPYFTAGAGPNQVSEVETRAVVDFAFDHPNIAVVFSFSPDDNLFYPWKPESSSDSARIKTSVSSSDSPYLDFIAKEYQRIHGSKDSPVSAGEGGTFPTWAYFHYGRWSLAARAWWVPKIETGKKDDAKKDGSAKQEGAKDKTAQGQADDLNALRWFARQRIDGFVPWQPVKHPDFSRKKVEVGGFKPFVRLNPPAKELDPLAEKHWLFLRRLAELMPRLAIREVKTEPLGSGVWRVTAAVANEGFLPTVSQMGRTTRQPHPLQAAIELPKDAKLVTGYSRVQISTLPGSGAEQQQIWLVEAGQAKPVDLRIRVWSPSVGSAETTVSLKTE